MSALLFKTILLAKAIQFKGKKTNHLPPIPKVKIKYLCRICCKEDGIIPIFENIVRPNLPQEIEMFSGLPINKSDCLSENMCKICLKLLDCCITFRELCQKSNKLLTDQGTAAVNDIVIKNESRDEIDAWEDINFDYLQGPSPFSSLSVDSDLPLSSDAKHKVKTENNTCIKKDQETKAPKRRKTKVKKEKKSVAPKKDKKVPKETGPKRKWERTNLPKVGRSCLCNICGRTLSSPACLAEHMATHSTEFPYECNLCPYKGRTRGLLHVHKRSHLPEHERPYKCTQCPKTTATSANLLSHMRRTHSTARPFKCDQCDRTFTCPQNLNNHIRVAHLPAENVACEICAKTYANRRYLGKHRRKVHKIKLCEGNMPHNLPSFLRHNMNADNGEQKEQMV